MSLKIVVKLNCENKFVNAGKHLVRLLNTFKLFDIAIVLIFDGTRLFHILNISLSLQKDNLNSILKLYVTKEFMANCLDTNHKEQKL
jgi:hypothetical protein